MHDNSGSWQERRPTPPSGISAPLKTLWQRRVLIVLAASLFVVLAGIYIAVTRPVYIASASILVDPGGSRQSNSGNAHPGISADSAAVASQVSVIGSRRLLAKVFRDEHLVDDPEFSARGPLSGLMALVGAPRPLSEAAVFDNFRNHVSVERERSTYVIDVGVTSHDPAKAARIANAVSDSYMKSLSDRKDAASRKAANFLDGRLADLRKQVVDAERAVDSFKSDHHIYDTDTGSSLSSQIDRLDTQLGNARNQASRAERRYEQAADAGDTPKGMVKLSAILNSAAADKLRQQYNQQAAALAHAETVYGSRHPTIISLKAELSRIEGLMAQEAGRIMGQLKAERDLADGDVEKLEARLAALRDRANQANLDGIKLRQLERQADAARALLDDFTRRTQKISHLADVQLPQARVIDRAAAPVTPVWPRPTLLVLVSAFFGLLVGCAIALLAGPRMPKDNSTARRPRQSEATGQPRQIATATPNEAKPAPTPSVVPLPVKSPSTERRHEAAEPAKPKPTGPKSARPRLTVLQPPPARPSEPRPIAPGAAGQQSSEPQPAVFEAAEPQPTEPGSIEAAASGLPSLGVYDLPPATATTTRAQIKAIRESLKEPGQSPLLLAVLRLIRQIVGRLDQHAEPFILHVSSVGGAQRKLAAALIGIGLQQLEKNVLIVEIADRPAGPSPLTSVSASRGTARFTDPASGLPTIVVGTEAAGGGMPSIETILAKAGPNVDFVVIAGRPLSDASQNTALDVVADLSIYAVGSTDEEAAAAACFDGCSADGRATVVIRRPIKQHAESGFRPRLVVSRTRSGPPPAAGRP